MTFEDFFKNIPGAADFVAGMPKVWPISLLQDVYAPFGALHLVGLALMGGAVILLNLRLMGAGLTSEQPSTLEKNLRPWFITGLCIVLGTGIIIGMLNSDKLYKSVPFFVKILSLIAACIFSFGVTNAVAKSDGKTSRPVIIAGAVAFLIWAFALGVFSMDGIAAPGLFHPLAAGFAILVIFGQRIRWLAAGAFVLLFGGQFLMYWIVGFNTYEPMFDDISRYIMIAATLIMIGLFGYEVYAGKADAATPLARLIALMSILTWVTVAAGGRWIGFAA
jgi:peptidoglycan/LPS O-acetylase OafA/YrhL